MEHLIVVCTQATVTTVTTIARIDQSFGFPEYLFYVGSELSHIPSPARRRTVFGLRCQRFASSLTV
jgi:hypothetical protein